MTLSTCGIDCDACKYAEERGCPGCHALKGVPFWGRCDLYACAADKNLPHCGACSSFPCATLQQWAEGENPERIQNLIDQNAREARA